MRKYIRHPSDIPIEFSVEGEAVGKQSLHDVGFGGLSFSSTERIPPGTQISISIPFVNPPFESSVVVKWCRKRGKEYDIGVAFSDPDDAFRARMIEQICHIEHYKREALTKEGRKLTGEEAASEWIKRFASKFPRLEEQE
jgi:hypothetical protein